MGRGERRSVGDTALGVVQRGRLSALLAALHAGGLGPQARVFDPARGDVAAQLQRANLPVPPEVSAGDADPKDDLVVVGVAAPGRAARAAETMLLVAAARVYVTTRGATAFAQPLAGLEEGADAAP